MRVAIFIAAAVALCGCSARPKNPHDQIMDRIESGVNLPAGANQLRDYARYYALDDKGLVWAVYALPGPPPSGQEVCFEMDGAIPPEKWEKVPCPEEAPEQAYLPAGQRRWMSNPLVIPTAPDTLGCEQITFRYDAVRDTFATKPECSNQYQIMAAEQAAREREAERKKAKPR
jgi:hypothetical protein